MPTVKSKVLALGIYVIDVKPIPPCKRNNREVHLDYLKHLKKSVATLREIVEEAKVEKPLDSSLTSACLYTNNSQELVEYVIGPSLNDFNKGDKQIPSTPVTRKKRVTFSDPCETSTNNTLTHVKQQTMNKTNELVIPSTGVKGATAASGQFCDFDLEVAFRKHSCYVPDTDDVELIKGSRGSNLYTISVEDMMNTGPAPTFMMPGQISSGLIPNRVPAAPYVPPTNKDLEILFQPMFDEYIEPPRIERSFSPTLAVLFLVDSASTPSSTTIDQDAPSLSHSPSSSTIQSLNSHKGVTAGSTTIANNPFAPIDNDPFVNMFAPEHTSEASSSGDVSFAESTHVTQPNHHLGKWRKDHVKPT
uniref:Integrase, catalytic region, zinc finger, CCHC-type, peptidase aspartic, catalytic n=1 Tax=Tanacetum cinerariifolium TaxID=118510 RepID=A0A699GRF7_TANCI|nr:hypothetical protein [Tanacetum cinerariifolium]